MAAIAKSCTLTLSIKNSQDPALVPKKKFLIIAEQSVERINQMVANFFQLKEPSDLALFASAFTNNLFISHYSFITLENQSITYQIDIEGETSFIFHPKPLNQKYKLEEKPDQKLAITIDSPHFLQQHELKPDEILKNRSDDQILVQFYNCHSFTSITEVNRFSKMRRMIDKLPIDAPIQACKLSRAIISI